jgi:hypothetical protein
MSNEPNRGKPSANRPKPVPNKPKPQNQSKPSKDPIPSDPLLSSELQKGYDPQNTITSIPKPTIIREQKSEEK